MSGISGAHANQAKKHTKNAIHVRWKARIGALRMLKRSIRVALSIVFPQKKKGVPRIDREADAGDAVVRCPHVLHLPGAVFRTDRR
jgi:hypothetical protein